MKKWNKVSFGWGQKGYDIDADKSLLVTNIPIPNSDGKHYRLGLLLISSDQFGSNTLLSSLFPQDFSYHLSDSFFAFPPVRGQKIFQVTPVSIK